MITIQPGLYVVIEQLETPLAPVPRPLLHGFSKDVAYLVLGAFSLSESGDAYFILSNDEDQIWFISNRHLRTYRLLPASTEFRLALSQRNGAGKQNGVHPQSVRRHRSAPNGVRENKKSRAIRRSLTGD